MHSPLRFPARPMAGSARAGVWSAFVCAFALLAAGCHHNSNNSGYGFAWVSLTAEPGDFASYVVTIDSITLTDTTGNVYTALATAEPVDFTKLSDVNELWGSATIPNDTYVSATITLDYTAAQVAVLVNGVPQFATLAAYNATALTTVSLTVTFDPANPLVITPSADTSFAQRLSIDFDLAASNFVNLNTSPPTVYVNPFITVAIAPSNTRLIRVRGPVINSSTLAMATFAPSGDTGSYTVYVRPFYDQVNSVGSLTLFNQPSTNYTIDGTTYVGAAGLSVLSQEPAGSTMAIAYATYQPTPTAGNFYPTYVIAGSSVQTNYTENVAGDVIARSGNTLTVRGSTLYGTTVSLTQGYFAYQIADTNVLVGPGTIVTADGDAGLSTLNYNSIAVGQHIVAIGTYGVSSTGVVTIDASVSTEGQVRLQSTQLFGQLLTAAPGTLGLNLQSINDWPVSDYTFAGNGTSSAEDSSPADYKVNTAAINLTGTAAGTPLWINGYTNSYGSAPPDFNALGISQESAQPAVLHVTWDNGALNPFATVGSDGFTIDLSNVDYSTGVIRLGADSIDLRSLPASPNVVPTSTAFSLSFSPLFTVGNPPIGLSSFSSFASFLAKFDATVSATTPVSQLTASGYYDPATNIFTANSIDILL